MTDVLYAAFAVTRITTERNHPTARTLYRTTVNCVVYGQPQTVIGAGSTREESMGSALVALAAFANDSSVARA